MSKKQSRPPASIHSGLLPVLVVEDDKTTSALICSALHDGGLEAIECHSAGEVHEVLQKITAIGAAIVDLELPDGNGIDVIRRVRQTHPNLPFYVLTAHETVQDAVLAMKAGASDYFLKPFDPVRVIKTLEAAISSYQAAMPFRPEVELPQSWVHRWKSPRMSEALNTAVRAAKTLSPVLISGPKNTGKRMIANLIHQKSKRGSKPLFHINAELMPPHEIETELFGARLTPNTPSILHRRGKLEKSGDSTLLIENIDRLGTAAQCALAEWLKEHGTAPRGRLKTCRLICTSSADLDSAVAGGTFRDELRYLIGVYRVTVPSIAERPEDLPDLCEHVVTTICVSKRLRRPSFTRKAMEILMDHSWPGNFAELHSVLEHAVTHTNDGLITPDDLPKLHSADRPLKDGIPLGHTSIDELSKASLLAALHACEGNRRRAAQRLKVSLRTVYNMIQRYGVNETLPSGRKMMGERMRRKPLDKA